LDLSPVVAKVSSYEIRADELAEGFLTSAYAARADKVQARREYLDTLIDQKLILLDAQKRGLDKAPDFLKSVEKFWAQSLLAVAVGKKAKEMDQGITVRDEDIRRVYESAVKGGVTEKPLQDVYPQIKVQAQKAQEGQLLKGWIEGLRQNTAVSVDEDVLKTMK